MAFSLCYLEKIKVFLGIFQNKIAMKLTKTKYSDENQMPAFGSRSFVLAAPRKPHATQSSLDVRSFYLWLCRFILIFFFFFNSAISIYFVINFVFFFFLFFTCSHKLIKPAKDIKNCLAHRITQKHQIKNTQKTWASCFAKKGKSIKGIIDIYMLIKTTSKFWQIKEIN